MPQEDNNWAKLWLCYSPSRQATAQPQFGSICAQKIFETFFAYSTQLQVQSLMAQQSCSSVALVPHRSQFNYLMSLPWTNPYILQPDPLKAWIEFQLCREYSFLYNCCECYHPHINQQFFHSNSRTLQTQCTVDQNHTTTFTTHPDAAQVMLYMSNSLDYQNPIVLLAYLSTLSSHTYCLIKLFWQFPQLLTTCATLYLIHHHPNSLPRSLKLQVFLTIGLHLCLWLKALLKTTP